ncbi:hypothetical protein Hdeb2414_s0023g00623181 [Helianthus debilis subsp. tardiflorus]
MYAECIYITFDVRDTLHLMYVIRVVLLADMSQHYSVCVRRTNSSAVIIFTGEARICRMAPPGPVCGGAMERYSPVWHYVAYHYGGT